MTVDSITIQARWRRLRIQRDAHLVVGDGTHTLCGRLLPLNTSRDGRTDTATRLDCLWCLAVARAGQAQP